MSKGDFERRHYDAVSQAVKPDLIFNALQATYGKSLNVQNFPYSDGTLSDERVAQQFAWLHSYVQQKAKEQQASQEGPQKER